MDIPLLPDLVKICCLSIGVLLVCHKIRIPPIVGFLLTGALCGPTALGLVENVEAVELLSEVGVVLLLFTIGMEMSVEELVRLRKPLFLGGSAQTLLTVVGSALLVCACGKTWQEGVMFGFLAALSSTAIVLSRLQQKAQAESPHGRLVLAVMIFQDLAVVPMMLAVPFLAGRGGDAGGPTALLISAARTVAFLGGGWILAKHATPWIVKQVMRTRSKELLLMTVLGLCFAVAMGTACLGLSLALGAFLAGLLLAGSEYSLNALEGVRPFKEVFTSLFFISVGMLLDVRFFADHALVVVCVAASLIVLKALLALPAAFAVGYPARTAVLAAMSLAQIGEFSFVLARSAVDEGLLDGAGYQMFLAASVLTMLLTPPVMDLAPAASSFLARRLRLPESAETPKSAGGTLKNHLVVVGFGVCGRHLARTAKETGIPYVVLEMNPDTVARCRETEPIYCGDASLPAVLERFGVREARALAVVVSDPSATRAITAAARKLNPRLYVVARTRFLGEVEELRGLGADDVVSEEFETSVEIFSRVLGRCLVPVQTVRRFVNAVRAEQYGVVRTLRMQGSSLSDVTDEVLTDLEVVACKVEPGSAVAGRSLAETALRQKYGVTVVGLRRDGRILPSPGGAEVLRGGDTAYLFASQEALSEASPLFEGPASA